MKGEVELECCDRIQQLCPSVTIGHVSQYIVGNKCEISKTWHRRKQTFDFIQGGTIESDRQLLQIDRWLLRDVFNKLTVVNR
jgi:hypothetical protein